MTVLALAIWFKTVPRGTPNLTRSPASFKESHRSCMIDVFWEFKTPIECDHTKPVIVDLVADMLY